jgi:2-pyrone-4,6-dicarboxylate lactonase
MLAGISMPPGIARRQFPAAGISLDRRRGFGHSSRLTQPRSPKGDMTTEQKYHAHGPGGFPLYRRDTRTPTEPPPPGSCDCHVHVFDATQAARLSPGRIYNPPDAAVDDLLAMHRRLGIERGVIVQAAGYGTDHEVMLQAMAAAGPSYRGVAIVNDSVPDAELARLDAAGVRGARFNFAGFLKMAPKPDVFRRNVARVQELGWHIKVFTVGDDLIEHAATFQALPVPIVFDHMGFLEPERGPDQPAFRLLLDMLEQDDRWVMLSNADRRSKQGQPWDDMRPYVERCIEAAPDRVIWCTDWPHLTYERAMPNDADLLEFLYRCCPDAALRRKVLVDNPARLYGFS